MEKHPIRRKAFTLVELLVVIAIIGILIALLLPAVQAAREAARRSSCVNNVKQLALAMHNYHDTHKTLPMCYCVGGYNWQNRGHSWIQMVLPFIEQSPLADQVDYTFPVGDDNNRNVNTGVAKAVISPLICPSDANNRGGSMNNRANMDAAFYFGVSNYKAVAGSNWQWGDAVCRHSTPYGRFPNDGNGLDHGNGIICRNGNQDRGCITKFSDIQDGLSNTFAVGEAVPDWCTHTWWYWFNGTTATCGIPLNYISAQIVNNPGVSTLETQRGDWGNNYSFMSRHPGGANFAFCDGSVDFISDTVNLATYRLLANMSDKQVVNR